uniref:Uncharacterized protein n=1 Tax=Oryza barthii TaxID=65489 RepID=A0A0D3F0M4_9ORYZ
MDVLRHGSAAWEGGGGAVAARCARLHRCSAETAALGDGARRRRTSSDLRDGDATAVAEEVEQAAVARWRRRRERASAAEFEGTADMAATSRTARTATEAATES